MRIVREQRATPGGDEITVVSAASIAESGGDYVSADDYRDLRYELLRLRAAVMGERSPGA